MTFYDDVVADGDGHPRTFVRIDRSDDRAVVTLDDPDKLNVLSAGLTRQLRAALEAFTADRAIRPADREERRRVHRRLQRPGRRASAWRGRSPATSSSPPSDDQATAPSRRRRQLGSRDRARRARRAAVLHHRRVPAVGSGAAHPNVIR